MKFEEHKNCAECDSVEDNSNENDQQSKPNCKSVSSLNDSQ